MRSFSILFVGLASIFPGSVALSQSAEPGLRLELNRVHQVDGACRLTFLAQNTLGAAVDALSLETVLLTRDGIVDRLTIFDFGMLPNGVPRVRQFDLAGMGCESLGQVLVNGVAACETTADCTGRIDYTTRTDVEILG